MILNHFLKDVLLIKVHISQESCCFYLTTCIVITLSCWQENNKQKKGVSEYVKTVNVSLIVVDFKSYYTTKPSVLPQWRTCDLLYYDY